MTDMERILQAIESQRWFFFANNDKILFDSRTALTWANFSHFTWWHKTSISALYAGCRIDHYYYGNSYEEVKDLISKQNSQKFGGFSDWRIPAPDELWNMIEDKSFPFGLDFYWCINKNGNLAGKNLDINGANNGISTSTGVYVLPCSSALVPQYFSATPKEIFDIFKANELIPIFDDKEINELYKKILTEPPQYKKSTSSFDCQSILERFDVEAVDKSAIRYYEAVLSVVDELLATLPENDTSEVVAEKKRKLSFVKDQAETFFKRLDEINTGYDSICELAKLEAMPRPSFAFLVESLTRIINEQ